MKWVNHQATAFCVTMAVSANPVLGIITTVGSCLPDAIEMSEGAGKYGIHRGMSHDIIFWIPVLLCLLVVTHLPALSLQFPLCAKIPQMFGVGTTIGVLIHLMTDGLSKGGIPVLYRHRFAAGWYKTFTWSEYKVSLFICLPCLAIAWISGHLNWKIDTLMSYLCG